MTERLRRAGRGRDSDGWWVIWSVAEGRRGRRWREVRQEEGIVASSLLLETDQAGRFSHLELSTSAGLLTLHPERDGSLHGNTVTLDGIAHVRGLAWDPDGLVVIEGSTISTVAAVALQRPALLEGASISRPGVVVKRDLSVELSPIVVTRTSRERWLVGDDPLEVDAAGLPVLRDAETWPLED